MANYVEEKDLQAIISAYQADGSRGNDLAQAAMDIAKNLWRRDKIKLHGDEDSLDDYIQEAAVAVLAKIHLYNRGRGTAFNFLTRMICNRMTDSSRKEVRVVRKQIQSIEQMQNDPYVLRRMSRYAA